ncbi:hypothetical protein BDP55DRAFT_773573 [Colletotrichum godetiae]|uniref:Uncharacterized protein n=1 Tax=Colletotrichum godetiae TaxID=1209918 RepID=A0AAJ0ELX7_9PEZI|nr:uncharacterized protein BDP55DRAFT_773573 [Colletotrichum godetiae]KAK1658050.1 hypothetical protein BDP55DRAFT_773573 [Colletotrichum godetiae]
MVGCGRRHVDGCELIEESWRGVGTPNLASSLQPPRCHGTDDVGRPSHVLASPGRPAFWHAHGDVSPTNQGCIPRLHVLRSDGQRRTRQHSCWLPVERLAYQGKGQSRTSRAVPAGCRRHGRSVGHRTVAPCEWRHWLCSRVHLRQLRHGLEIREEDI